MNLFSTSHLRTRLIAIALIAVVPALIAILYTQSVERGRTRQWMLEDNLRQARVAAGGSNHAIAGALGLLQTVADLSDMTGDQRACDELLSKLLNNHPEYRSLMIVEPGGAVFCSSLPTILGVSVRSRAWFERAMSTRVPVVSDYQPGDTDLAGIVVARAQFGPSGEVERVLAVSLALDRFFRQESAPNLAPGTQLTLFDQKGAILARYPDSGESLGQAVLNPFSTKPATQASDVVDAVAPDGIRRMYTTVAIESDGLDTGLRLAMAVDQAGALAEAHYLTHQNLWLLLIVSLATAAAVTIASDLFVLRPLKSLTTVISRLAAGELGVRAQLARGVPGLGELAASFNIMAAALEARQRERDRAEQQLRESEEHYRVPFENMPHPSFLFDAATLQIMEVNRAACERYGYTRDEFLHMNLKDIRPPEEIPTLEARLPQLQIRSASTQTSWIHRKKDGALMTVEISSMPVMLRGRRAVIALVEDVSERKQLEQRLLQIQKIEAVGRLAGGIAHDFNNLLTVILGFGELALQRLDSNHPVRPDLEEVQQAAESAKSLTRQLLAFSRKQVLQPQVIDLNGVVRRMTSMLQRVIGEDIELVTHLDPSLGHVNADPGQIEQVVMNLAVNARDAMPGGGQLTIATANVDLDPDATINVDIDAGAYVLLKMRDTGTGMDETVQSHLFEPFFTTKGRDRGTGLGLATVYGIVKQSGGSIWVESSPGHGATFQIYLPRVKQPIEAAATRAPEPLRGKETILLVEDQPAVLAITLAMLSGHGYTVLQATSGDEALRIIRQHPAPIDLLLTDVVMPSMSGPELARQLPPGTRVLYTSGYTDDAILNHGVLDPDVAFIGKPFTLQALLQKVREVLDTPLGESREASRRS